MKRFSLNHITTKYWDQGEAIEACARLEIGIGLWREPVADKGLATTARQVRDSGVAVTSLCRGGFLTGSDPAALDDNRRAIDEAAELGAGELVMVCGGIVDRAGGIDGARQRVADGLAELAPYAEQRGVRLAIEPLHPMYASDRCVISTLDQALELSRSFPAHVVGVVVDTYHVWWDPAVFDAIAAAGDRIASFQVGDWITPLPAGVLTGRGQLGDGCVDFKSFRRAVEAAGYTGPIEVELFNDELWSRPGAEVLAETIARYEQYVA